MANIPCTDTSDRETYLNNPEVRAALHVPDFVKAWEPCTTLDYDREYDDMTPQYLKVLEQVIISLHKTVYGEVKFSYTVKAHNVI